MSLLSDQIKTQIHVTERKLDALATTPTTTWVVGNEEQCEAQYAAGVVQVRLLEAEVDSLKELLLGENLVEMLRSK